MFRNVPVFQDGAVGPEGDSFQHSFQKTNQKVENTLTALDHKINSIFETLQQQQLEIKVMCW
jgi:hypothetical protein